ncbi:MAG: hypothetical protein HYR80_02415 [Nitrospirae bacterium]|nr:hypothetical protein [Nitrospirota bacterium]
MKKPFDCVEMKNKIQAMHLKLFKGLSFEEKMKIIEGRLKNDPELSRFLPPSESKSSFKKRKFAKTS